MLARQHGLAHPEGRRGRQYAEARHDHREHGDLRGEQRSPGGHRREGGADLARRVLAQQRDRAQASRDQQRGDAGVVGEAGGQRAEGRELRPLLGREVRPVVHVGDRRVEVEDHQPDHTEDEAPARRAERPEREPLAEQLFLSITTVKTYVTRLLSKLDARDRVHLVILAYEAGLVTTSR
ncbi:response regulator transcription factor [Streptacidiphilus sp. MAP12-20]|uniref:response regulator transcription factor n=1 Tax=Streptacidiphilus sp. MAP12-20 TaxID=3156299 RepID=UPI00351758CE